jgi:hypothetical protein
MPELIARIEGICAPEKVWLELQREKDSCDVIVCMDDGSVYTTLFVTFSYLRRQMDLNYRVTQDIDDTPAVRYVLLDTPHILVDKLTRDIIEDTIDNLIALDVFESHFTRVTEVESDETPRTSGDGTRATQEVAAVVISDVLLVQD